MMTNGQIDAAERAHNVELGHLAEEAWMREWDAQVDVEASRFEVPC